MQKSGSFVTTVNPPDPPVVELQRFGPTTRDTAIALGKAWLAEMAERGVVVEGVYEVAYEDPTGAPQVIRVDS